MTRLHSVKLNHHLSNFISIDIYIYTVHQGLLCNTRPLPFRCRPRLVLLMPRQLLSQMQVIVVKSLWQKRSRASLFPSSCTPQQCTALNGRRSVEFAHQNQPRVDSRFLRTFSKCGTQQVEGRNSFQCGANQEVSRRGLQCPQV